MVDPLTHDWGDDRLAVMHALHEWSVRAAELTHDLSRWVGLPTSDADALAQIVFAAESGEPLSPSALSRRIGLTSGATSVLLDRLEVAGHVSRSRESTDRRHVTLRPSEIARERTRAFLAAAGAEISDVLVSASDREIRVVAAFLARLTTAVTQAQQRIASAPPQ